MGKNRTPLIRQLRSQGGTLYTFASATEDIGLNINEKNNRVALSHYALLNIPVSKTTGNISEVNNNRFNVSEILGAFDNLTETSSEVSNVPNVLLAESFQNYALNLETILLNQESYNYSLSRTVSERVFWKWLKETGAIRWTYNTNGYWSEPINEDGYSQVVQCYGEIFTGAQRSDTFGMYNETYVKIPTSYGQTLSYFKTTPDINYDYEMVLNINENKDFIVGQDNDIKPNGLSVKAYYDFLNTPNVTSNSKYNLLYQDNTGVFVPGWWYTKENLITNSYSYLTDSSIIINDSLTDYSLNTVLQYQPNQTGSSYIFKRSNLDCVSLELNLNNLRDIYNDTTLTFDKIAIENSIGTKFDFNTILVYYSIYDSQMKNVLSTNLFGVLFLDSAVSNTGSIGATGPTLDFYIPTFTKKQSTTNGFGTAYSFRLNIKSSSIYDDTNAAIYDESTSESLITSDFNDVIYNLNKSVEILGKNSNLLNTISNDYLTIKNQNIVNTSKLIEIEQNINNILGNKFSYLNLTSLLTESINVSNIAPIGDSSIINFLINGNIIGKIEGNTFTYSNFSGGGFTSNSFITALGSLNTNSITTNNKTSLDIFISTSDASNIVTNKNNFRFDDVSLYSKNYIGFVNAEYADTQMIGGNGYNFDISTGQLIQDIMSINVGEFRYNSTVRNNDSSHYGIDTTSIDGKYIQNLKGEATMPWMQNEISYSTFNYVEMIPLLIKTIQYLNNNIASLNNTVSELTSKMNALEQK